MERFLTEYRLDYWLLLPLTEAQHQALLPHVWETVREEFKKAGAGAPELYGCEDLRVGELWHAGDDLGDGTLAEHDSPPQRRLKFKAPPAQR